MSYKFLMAISLLLMLFFSCSKKNKDNGEGVGINDPELNEDKSSEDKDADFEDGKKIMKLMTFNIQHGVPLGLGTDQVDLNGIASVINKEDPDLVALQEVDYNTKRAPYDEAKELGELTDMDYYFAKAIDFQGGEYGLAILSRNPIKTKKKYVLPMPNKGEQRIMIVISTDITEDLEIAFASTHLELDAQNRLAQAEKINQISQVLNKPLFVCGDFNAEPHENSISKLEEEFLFFCSRENCPLTFKAGSPTKAIDYIVLNSNGRDLFEKISYRSILTRASDHLPIIAEFKID